MTTRVRGAPSASAASRRESGTSSSTTSEARVTTGSISSASATEPFQPAKLPPMPAQHQDDVDEQAEDDRGHARQDVHEVADDVREARLLAVLDEIEGHADPGRHRHRGGQADDQDRAHDRALDPARVAEEAAARVGGEEAPAPGADPLLDQVVEDEDQRHERDQGRDQQDRPSDLVGAPPPRADCRERADGHAPAPPAAMRVPCLRSALITNALAMALTSSVRTNSTSPAAISDARWSGLDAASPNSLAITAASV